MQLIPYPKAFSTNCNIASLTPNIDSKYTLTKVGKLIEIIGAGGRIRTDTSRLRNAGF